MFKRLQEEKITRSYKDICIKSMKKKRVENINFLIQFLLLCLAGYAWIFFNLYHHSSNESLINACMFKNITGIPCPSCGTTRGILLLINFDFIDAFMTNPFSYIVMLLMILIPVWILFDLLFKSNSFLKTYFYMDLRLKEPKIIIPIFIAIIINWIWNLSKGL